MPMGLRAKHPVPDNSSRYGNRKKLLAIVIKADGLAAARLKNIDCME
jgi:hypothetical protein